MTELAAQSRTYPDVEILIVDNNSKDHTRKTAESLIATYPGIIRYIFEAAAGPCRVRNRGFEESNGEILAFIDDDALPHSNWVGLIRDHFLSGESDCLVGRVIAQPEGGWPDWFPKSLGWILAHTEYGGQKRDFCFPEGLPACNMAIRKDVYERIGGFNENLKIYFEEGEFFFRLSNQGYKTIYDPAIVIDHCPAMTRMTKEQLISQAYQKGRGFANTFMLSNDDLRRRASALMKNAYLLGRVSVSWLIKPRFDKRITIALDLGWIVGLLNGQLR